MIHPFGYLTVLALAKWGDTSTTSAGIFPNLMQTFADIHAKGGQFGTLIKGIKDADNFRITLIRRHPAGTVTTVVTDVERLITSRGRSIGG
ncbi:hypothetical protein BACCELL_02350 [Bacteroides cellulosilyticus DSM 14838]|uniref:Uncharacterized protein n=1 Tax=Bacteroides cellulosilyticus DSM 14838 TaxID=537012 RepID=E2NDI9_9BACE|nr:hypothetical protein BACCELL_02350 [Bacteroides cellulosilyticus DSM 14838]